MVSHVLDSITILLQRYASQLLIHRLVKVSDQYLQAKSIRMICFSHGNMPIGLLLHVEVI